MVICYLATANIQKKQTINSYIQMNSKGLSGQCSLILHRAISSSITLQIILTTPLSMSFYVLNTVGVIQYVARKSFYCRRSTLITISWNNLSHPKKLLFMEHLQLLFLFHSSNQMSLQIFEYLVLK